MSTATFKEFTGNGAENYRRYFEPAIGIPVSDGLMDAAALQPGERVLDVACGTGVIARRAADAVGENGSVAGVDLAPDMIEVARQSQGGRDISWHVADAQELPFPDGSYDVVLSQLGLMFMANPVATLSEMRRVLAPGGRIVLSTAGRIQPPFERLEAAIVEHINPDLGGFVRAVFSMNNPEAVGKLFRNAGFEGVSTTEYTATLDLPEPADFLWQYINLTPMGPFVEPAPAEAKDAMERQVVKTWAPFVVNGRTPVNQPMVLVTAHR